jgi:hypothetical protein
MLQRVPYRGVWSYYSSQQVRSDGIAPDDAFYLASLENLVGVVHSVTVDHERFQARDAAPVRAELDALSREASLGDATFVEVVLLEVRASAAMPDSPGPQWYADTAQKHLGARLVDVDMLICGEPAMRGVVRLALLTPWGQARMAILCNERPRGTAWCAALEPFIAVPAARRAAMRDQALVTRPVTLETLAAFPLPYLERTWMTDAQAVCRGSFQRATAALFALDLPPPETLDDAGYLRAELVQHLLLGDDDDGAYNDSVVMEDASTQAIALFPVDHAAQRGFNIHAAIGADRSQATVSLVIKPALLRGLLPSPPKNPMPEEDDEEKEAEEERDDDDDEEEQEEEEEEEEEEKTNEGPVNPSACIGTVYQLALWARFVWQSLLCVHHPLAVTIDLTVDGDQYPTLAVCVTQMLSGVLVDFWSRENAANKARVFFIF